MARVIFRGSRAELRALLAQLPALLTGQIPDPTGEVRAMYVRLGMVALSIIKEAFIVKARHGTDEAGLRWQPLAPSTIARRRKGKKQQAGLFAELPGFGPNDVEILRDTSRLFNSLSPGIENTIADQLFEVLKGGVLVGTNVEYAVYHHSKRMPRTRLPRRPLWPDWREWPDQWRKLLWAEIYHGIARVLERLISSGDWMLLVRRRSP